MSLKESEISWSFKKVQELYETPFVDLLYQAQTIHRENHKPNEVQLSSLLSIKTGACPEDCKYCPQSGHYKTSVEKESLMDLDDVIKRAKLAKANGATRFCMGAAWKSPPKKQLPKVAEMISAVKALGLESCVTLGMLDDEDTKLLKEAGLDYYNHNLDTSENYYKEIISTRTYQDRLDTIARVQNEGIKVCCGGIIGLGESREDRINFLLKLANIQPYPESVPINRLIAAKGTPLERTKKIDNFEFIKTIAIAKILMPKSRVRISAGREDMSDEMQALCFMAGASSIFLGDTLLTCPNPKESKDFELLDKLKIQASVS